MTRPRNFPRHIDFAALHRHASLRAAERDPFPPCRDLNNDEPLRRGVAARVERAPSRLVMPQTRRFGRKISRMTLGTVQLGQAYGIANRTGQPSTEEARRILSAAVDGGITAFDTAPGYGQSESILGQVLGERAGAGELLLITKLPGSDHRGGRDAKRRHVRESVGKSLQNLRLETLPLYLLHRAADLADEELIEALRGVMEEGLVEHLGVSTYTPDEAETALARPEIEAIQVPFSLVDQRLLRSGWLRRAADRGVAVFARSVFLQGLLLMAEEDVPAHLRGILPFHRKLGALAASAGISRRDLCLAFVAAQEGVTSVLVGVEREAQLREDLASFTGRRLDRAALEGVESSFGDVPEDLLNPSRWDSLKGRHA